MAQHRRGGRLLLEPAAPAKTGIVRVARADRHVADLAGGATGAAVELAGDHDAHADAGAHPEEDEVRNAGAGAVAELAQRGQVDVVLEADKRAELAADRAEQALPAPAGQVGSVGEQGAGGIEHARVADTGVGDLRPVEAGIGGHTVGDRADLGHQRARAARAGALVAAGDDGAGDVGQRGPHPVGADVDPDHPARLRVELVEHGAGALAAGRAAHLVHEAGGQQATEGERDGRLREPAGTRDLGAGTGAGVADQLQHRSLVDCAKQTRLSCGKALSVDGRDDPPQGV